MELRVQLKICEGCGCLWYRAQNHRGAYCLGCDAKLSQFPTAESRRRRGPKGDKPLISIWAVAHNPMNEDLFMGTPVEAAGGVE
jgi:hypothetical protein